MKMSLVIACLPFVSLLVNCGSHEHRDRVSPNYSVADELSVAGTVALTYEQVFQNRSIAVGAGQAKHCQDIGAQYAKAQGVTLLQDSLKLSTSEAGKSCARRNALKQCESHEYIYRFTCTFRAG